MATRRTRRNPPLPSAPPKRRFAGAPVTTQQERSALARVRRIAGSVNERERPFSPERPGSWRGSSRDLVVNGKRRMQRNSYELSFTPEFFFAEGEPYDGGPELPAKRPISVWSAIETMRLTDPDQWADLAKEVFGLSNPDFLTPESVLEKVQETNTCGTLSSPVDVYIDPEGYFTLDVYDSFESNGGTKTWDEINPRPITGYAMVYDPKERNPMERWSEEMMTESEIEGAKFDSNQMIYGDDYAVFRTRDGVKFAQLAHMVRNGEVDPRDVPQNCTPAEINEVPDHNGQEIGYSQGYSSKREPGWYQVRYATGSDYMGGVTHESNYRVLSQMLDEHHPEDSQPVVWARTSGGHGTYGIVVRFGDLDDELREALDHLDDHPILDEDDETELEMEQQNEAWENGVRDDFIKALAKKLDIDDPDELETLITPEQWFAVFDGARESANEYWEDQQGAGQYIRVERVAKEAEKIITSRKLPQHSNDYQDDAFEALFAALPEED